MIKNLKTLREKMGVSQDAVAMYLGCSQQAVNKYENQKTEPDIFVLVKLAKYFNTSVDYLIGNTDNPTRYESQDDASWNPKALSMIEKINSLQESQIDLIDNLLDAFQQTMVSFSASDKQTDDSDAKPDSNGNDGLKH